MIQNNDSVYLEKCESFCSECKFVLNSIYSTGTALSINECELVVDTPKDRNSLLNDRVETRNKDIIDNADEKLHNSQSKLSSLTPHVKHKNSVTSEEEVQVLFDKKSKGVKKIDKEFNEFDKIYMFHDQKKYFTRVKPTIIEDKILQSSEQLKINDLKNQKSQILNYKCNDSKYSDINSSVIPTYSESQNTKNETRATMTSDYFSQYRTLRSTILNRRKKISNIAKNLLALSTHLNGICKTIVETEASNPGSIRSCKSFNLSKKVDKSTSPILLSKICPMVAVVAQSQKNSHDMYRYNPYRPKHNFQKNI